MNSTSELVYGNTDANYGDGGKVNRLIDNGTAIPQVDKGVVTQVASTDLSGDPRVLGFKDASGNDRVLVVSYRYDANWNPLDPEFVICDPTVALINGKWPVVKTLTHSDWSQVSNPYGIATIGSDMYVADYDNGRVVKIDMTNAAYTQSATVFYAFPEISGNNAHCAGIGLATVNNATKIVALFNQGPDYSSYLASTLALIDPSDGSAVYLGPTASAPTAAGLGQNAISMAVADGFAYVSSYGGPQVGGGNEKSKLEAVNLSNLTIVGTHKSDDTTDPPGMGDFVSTVVSGTNAFVLRASYTADWSQYNYKMYKTDTNTLQDSDDPLPAHFYSDSEPPVGAPSSYPGVTWMLALANGRLWAVLGDRIQGYNFSVNPPIREFDLSTYGSSSYSILDDDAFEGKGHVNTAAIAKETTVVMRGVSLAGSVSNSGVKHPAFISNKPEALALRKKLLEDWQKGKK